MNATMVERTLRVCADELRNAALEALLVGSLRPAGLVIDKVPDQGPPQVRTFELLDPTLRARTLKTAVDETSAPAVAFISDGFVHQLDSNEKRAALLLVGVTRWGLGFAEALPYIRSNVGPPRFLPIQSSPQILRRYHSQIFGE